MLVTEFDHTTDIVGTKISLPNAGRESTPSLAMVFYSDGDKAVYAESFQFQGDQMINGKPLSEDALADILGKIKTKEAKSSEFYCNGLLPENLLMMKKDKAAWFVPAEVRAITFLDTTYRTIVPNMLFVATKRSLTVFACDKLDRTGTLYNAPFGNISPDGSVCMGSVKESRKRDIAKFMKETTDRFFNSKFTHLNNNGASTKNLATIYSKGYKKFPTSTLIKSKVKIKNIL